MRFAGSTIFSGLGGACVGALTSYAGMPLWVTILCSVTFGVGVGLLWVRRT